MPCLRFVPVLFVLIELGVLPLAVAQAPLTAREPPGDDSVQTTHAARRALQRGRHLERVAAFAEAAKHYEGFATTWPGHRLAPEALVRVVRLWAALGEKKLAQRALAKLQKMQQRQLAAVVARAAWQVVEHALTQGEAKTLVVALTRWLRRHPTRAAPGLALEAHARLAALAWEQSCPAAAENGLCLGQMPASRSSRRAPSWKRLVGRDQRQVALARRHVAKALSIWRQGRLLRGLPPAQSGQIQRIRRVRRWALFAQFLAVDFGFEAYLRQPLPKGLNFDPARPVQARRSARRLAAWIQRKARLADRLEQGFLAVAVEKQGTWGAMIRRVPPWPIAALARRGQVYHHLAERLKTTVLPGLPKPPYLDIYRQSIQPFYEPIERKAVHAFESCLRAAGLLGWHGTWSRLCERGLSWLAPDKYPLRMERHTAARHASAALQRLDFQLGAQVSKR